MIRDPSDGTVKGIILPANDINAVSAKQASKEITSGLAPTTTRSDYLARLERSREWLKEYRTASNFASPAGEEHGATL